MRRYYIEAYDAKGLQVLGNLDGQAALGSLRSPELSKAWTGLLSMKTSKRVRSWLLVDDRARIIAETKKAEAVA